MAGRLTSEIKEFVPEVEEFTRHTLKLAGAHLTEVQKGKWLAEIPAELGRELGLGEGGPGGPGGPGGSKLMLAFDAALAGEPSVEYVAPGSLFLDRLIAYAREKGKTASFLWPGPTDSPPGSPATPPAGSLATTRLEEWWQPLFANCAAAPVAARLFYQRHVFFCFRVAYISDEKREEIREFLVDPWSEKVVVDFNAGMDFKAGRDSKTGIMPELVVFAPPFGLSGTVRKNVNAVKVTKSAVRRHARRDAPENSKKLPLAEHLAKAGRLRQKAYQLVRLYQVACKALEEAIAPATARFAAEVRQRLDKESQQVEEYYAALRQEVTAPLRQLIHRAAGAAVHHDLARSAASGRRYERQLAALQKELRETEKACDRELGLLNAECERRLGELREKYAARVEVELVNAADIYLPRIVHKVELSQHGRVAAIVPVGLDLRTGKVYDFHCQGCGKALEQAYLDDTGAVACRECVELCERCGEVAAAYGKGLARCHICGRRICARCAATCSNPVVRSSAAHASSGTYASGGRLTACVDCRGAACTVCTAVWPAPGVQWRWGADWPDKGGHDTGEGAGLVSNALYGESRRKAAGKAVAAANILSQCFL